MPVNANGGPGGMVDETVAFTDTSAFSIGAFVDNLGSETQDYSVLFAASQTGGVDHTQIGVVTAGTEIRLVSIDSTGTLQLITSVQKASLTTAQQARVHIAFANSSSHRQLFLDAVVVADDTRAMTLPQISAGVILNYGVSAPVALGKLQCLSGFVSAADVALMRAGRDVRDVAHSSGGRLSAVFEFPLDHDFTETAGLYRGFLLNSNETYQRLLEVDVNATPGFSGVAVPTIAWSGGGAVSQAQSLVEE